MGKKILFLGIHRQGRSPSQRFRFEQYLDYLQQQGFDCELSSIIRAEDDKVFYGAGNYWGKLKILIRSLFKRWKETRKAKKYDLVFVQRESFMLGTTYFEKRFAQKTKLIFDFDDSIWLNVISEGNKKFKFLKDAGKTKNLIELSHMVFAGNAYLADYAKQFNPNVKIVPTTVDTDHHKRIDRAANKRVCIGWSGSFSTIEHLETALPALYQIKEKYGDQVYFKVIGDPNYKNEKLDIIGVPWTAEDEVEQMNELDIGLMPLPNDEWTKGKCGLKGLTYMSMEIPAIMSPVGVNTEIIEDGVNGFLAASMEDWVAKISLLVDNPDLRKKIGKKGREIVLKKYAVQAQRDNYIKYFNELIGE